MTVSADTHAANTAHAKLKALIDEASPRDLQCGIVAQITGFPGMDDWMRLGDGHYPLLGVLTLIIKNTGGHEKFGLRYRVCDLTVHGQTIVDAFTAWVVAAACEKHAHTPAPELTDTTPDGAT